MEWAGERKGFHAEIPVSWESVLPRPAGTLHLLGAGKRERVGTHLVSADSASWHKNSHYGRPRRNPDFGSTWKGPRHLCLFRSGRPYLWASSTIHDEQFLAEHRALVSSGQVPSAAKSYLSAPVKAKRLPSILSPLLQVPYQLMHTGRPQTESSRFLCILFSWTWEYPLRRGCLPQWMGTALSVLTQDEETRREQVTSQIPTCWSVEVLVVYYDAFAHLLKIHVILICRHLVSGGLDWLLRGIFLHLAGEI